ncbi:MAG: hypothetical protein H7X92_14030 [Chitinophagales bacterium]|nr:hypothetical protein [Hyphomicrobiales bacterium]
MSSDLQQILILSGIVFVIAYFGNLLSFGGRFSNALLTAILTAVAGAVLIFATEGQEALTDPSNLQVIGVAAGAVFLADLVANLVSFSNRLLSALTTAIVFAAVSAAVLFGVLSF